MLYTVKDRRSDYLPSFGVLMDEHDAAVVFTSETAARAYVASLGAMYRTVEIRSHVLLDFLLRLRIEGVKEIMIDPSGPNDPAAAKVPTYNLLHQATDCIEAALADVLPDEHGHRDRFMVVTCPHCGRVERVGEDDTLPVCCGLAMRAATIDCRRDSDSEATISAG